MTILSLKSANKIERLTFVRFTLFESHLTIKERFFDRNKNYTTIIGFRFKVITQYFLTIN